MRILSRRLAAYLPVTLTRQILQEGLPEPGVSRWMNAATMFADISGFSSMAEALAEEGPRGAEELNRALLITFTALINAIHDVGGAVSHFHGDAMMVYFPDTDGQAAKRALGAAHFLQRLLLSSFARVGTGSRMVTRTEFDLTFRIGVGYGRCQEMVVGEPGVSLEFVLGGTAVDEAVAAQLTAAAGQLVASQAIMAASGEPIDTSFQVLDSFVPIPHTEPGLYWDAFETDALSRLLKAAPCFMPPALHERLQGRTAQSIAEHRTVTTMFVQFEGIDFASEEAGPLLQAYYQWVSGIVRRYGGRNGRINRVLTGDKGNQLHIIFGAPVAPDAPEQAIRCALSLQGEKPDFIGEQRISLVAGRAFTGAVGSQNRREYTAVGRVVNLSARLTQYCPVGQVVVDEATARRVWEEITFKQLPPVLVKGRQQPVPIYQVQGERPRQTHIQARFAQWEKPPLGREEELVHMQQIMDKAILGQGGVVAISGPHGVGRLPFLAAGVRYWLAQGGKGLAGVAQIHTSDVPYAPWQTIWRDFFGLMPDMTLEAQTERMLLQAAAYCPDCGDEIQLWREPLNLLQSEQRLRPLPARVRQDSFFALVRRTLAAAALRQPLLIVLEDIHRADQSSLELLDHLAEVVAGLPILLVVTMRQSADVLCRALNRPICVHMVLDSLTTEEAQAVVRQYLGTDSLPAAVAQRLGLQDRQGRSSPVNPLFLEESLKVMLSSGVLQRVKGNSRLQVDEERLQQMQVPDSIYAVLLARLDQLPAVTRGLLQVAAVIGREFSLSMLVAATPDMTPETAVPLLDQLIDAEMIQLVVTEPTPVYLFRHAVLRDVVYQSLPYARRQALHAEIADLYARRYRDNLKPHYPVLAYHYGQTDRHEAGAKYAILAADEARAIFANRGAAELYKQAIMHLQALEIRTYWETAVRVYLLQSEVLAYAGEFEKALAVAEAALPLCLEQNAAARTLAIYNQMADIRISQGRNEEAAALTERVFQASMAEVTPEEVGRAHSLAGRIALRQGELVQAVFHLRQAEDTYLSPYNRPGLMLVWLARAEVAFQHQNMDGARQHTEAAVRLAREQGDPIALARALTAEAALQLRLGLPEEAHKTVAEAYVAARSSSENLLAHVLVQRAAVSLYLGQIENAKRDVGTAVELFGTMSDGVGLIQARLLGSRVYGQLAGEVDAGCVHLAHVETILTQHTFAPGLRAEFEGRLQLMQAALLVEKGCLVEAEEHLAQAITRLQEPRLVWWQPTAYLMQARLLLAVDTDVDARALLAGDALRQALRAVQQGGCPDELPHLFLQLAKLSEAEPLEPHWRYLEACVQAAYQRARFADRLYCFREAGRALLRAPEARLRRIGAGCLALAEA